MQDSYKHSCGEENEVVLEMRNIICINVGLETLTRIKYDSYKYLLEIMTHTKVGLATMTCINNGSEI